MRRLLAVGIDRYSADSLNGCVRDARRMSELLSENADGSPNFASRLIIDPPDTVTKAALRAGIDELFNQPAEAAVFYFAGHGTENNLGGYIVTPDATRYDEGVRVAELWERANAAAHIGEVVLILDSCHSGHLGAAPGLANDQALLRNGVSILTASRASEAAAETDEGGAFTRLVCDALAGGAADVLGEISAASVYAYVDQTLGAWDQRPLFKSHVSKMTTLRRARPAVSLDLLRRLPVLFPSPDFDFRLDRSFEPTQEPRDAENERHFGELQRLRAARLVDPVGEEHMYYAAINRGSCRLTPLGVHYRRLAALKRI